MANEGAIQRETQKRVASAIRRAMAERGMTQVELARRAMVAQPRISSLLAGDRGKFSAELLRVLDALGLKLDVVALAGETPGERDDEPKEDGTNG